MEIGEESACAPQRAPPSQQLVTGLVDVYPTYGRAPSPPPLYSGGKTLDSVTIACQSSARSVRGLTRVCAQMVRSSAQTLGNPNRKRLFLIRNLLYLVCLPIVLRELVYRSRHTVSSEYINPRISLVNPLSPAPPLRSQRRGRPLPMESGCAP